MDYYRKQLKENKIGDKAFKGINKKAVIKVPKSKLKKYKKILKEKGIDAKVKIESQKVFKHKKKLQKYLGCKQIYFFS